MNVNQVSHLLLGYFIGVENIMNKKFKKSKKNKSNY